MKSCQWLLNALLKPVCRPRQAPHIETCGPHTTLCGLHAFLSALCLNFGPRPMASALLVAAVLSRCGGRLATVFLPLGSPRLCEQLNHSSCHFFFVAGGQHGTDKACVPAPSAAASCAAGRARDCRQRTPPWAAAGLQARLAARRRDSMRMRSAPAKLGLRCSSSMPGDARIADCEGWCVRDALNASALSSADEPVADSCKYCKCRGCRLCYGRRLPSWATSTLKGIHVACELFGLGVCNSTGNLSNVIRAISDAAYARWEFNHTRLWIDAPQCVYA